MAVSEHEAKHFGGEWRGVAEGRPELFVKGKWERVKSVSDAVKLEDGRLVFHPGTAQILSELMARR